MTHGGMETVDTFRARYARTSDEDLLALIAVEPQNLTNEARLALAEEARRRDLQGPGVETLLATVTYTPWVDSTREMRYPKAPPGPRLLAWIVDGFVGAAAFVGTAAIGVFNNWLTGGGQLLWLAVVVSIIWAVYYSFAKDGRDGGQSIGKGMLDLMVVNVKTNQPCTKGESSLRALVMFALNLLPFIGFFIEPIMVLAAEDGRRLGDRAANTQVIRSSDYRPGSG